MVGTEYGPILIWRYKYGLFPEKSENINKNVNEPMHVY